MRTFLALLFLTTIFYQSLNAQVELSVQRGHHASVLVSDTDPSGKILASGGKDWSVRIWEINKGRELRSLPGHTSSIVAIDFHEEKPILISADESGKIIIWNYINGEKLHSFSAHNLPVLNVIFQGDKLISSGGDAVKIWDWQEERLIKSFQFDGGQRGLKVTANRDDIIVSGDDGYSYFFSLEQPEVIDTLRKIDYSFCGGCFAEAQFSTNQKWIATVAENGPLVLRDCGQPLDAIVLNEMTEDYNNIAFSPDSKYLLLSLEEKTEVYDLESKRLLVSIPERNKHLNHATFSQDSKSIFVSTQANTIDKFSLDGELLQIFKGRLDDPIIGALELDPNSYWESYAYRIATYKNKYKLSPNGKFAIKGKTGNRAIVWDVKSGNIYRVLKGHDKAIVTYEFSPDNKMLVTGDAEGRIVFWDLVQGDSIASRKYHFNMVLDMEFSRDGTTLATGGYDGYLNLVNLSSFELLKRLNFSRTQEFYDSPYAITFTPNDNYLMVGSLGKKFKMIEVDTGADVRELIGHTDVVSGMQYLSDHLLISSSWDGMLKAWDIKTGYQEWKLKASDQKINDLLFIKNKEWLVTAGMDRVIRIWDLNSKKLVKQLEGHKDQIHSLSYLSEGHVLISFAENGEIKYWDLNEAENVITQYFIGPEEWVIVNEKGFFNATERAKESVIFVNELKSYQPQQFFDQYYNADLKPLSFQHNRTLNERQALTELVKDYPVPEVEIIVPDNGQQFSKAKTNILVKVTNTGGGVKEIELKHNGKSIKKQLSDDSKIQQRGRSMMHNYELQLVPGQNIIEASAKNKENIESEKDQVIVRLEGEEAKGNCYVLAIGINNYKNDKLDMNYARADAESFAETLTQLKSNLFDHMEVTTLFDKDATKENILAALDEIMKKAGPSDVFCFYYAGHGSMVEDQFYFIPTESVRLYDKVSLEEEAISASEIQQKLKNIAALKQIIILDACQSGAGAQTLALRGADNEKALAQLSRSAGVHVLASSGSDQYATEFKTLGHGVFTYTLLEALKGNADGAPKDDVISVYELKSYLDAKVPVYSESHKGQPQYPYTFSIGQDFPLLIHQE